MAQGKINIPNPLKSRKFLLTLLLVIGATIGLYTGDVTWEQWFQFSQIVLGIYGVSNVGEHYTNAIKYKSDREKEIKQLELQIQKENS